MNAKKDRVNTRNHQANIKKSAQSTPGVQKSLATVCITNPHKNARMSLMKRLRKTDLLAFVSNPEISRGVRMATVASLDDVDLLVTIAVDAGPMPVRFDALIRIDELADGHPLPGNAARRLIPCLNEKELIARTVALMDMSDFDWCAQCTEETVKALFMALYECTDMLEAVLLEDALAYLTHRRTDLQSSLCTYDPSRYLMRSPFSPDVVNNVIYPTFAKEDNVA